MATLTLNALKKRYPNGHLTLHGIDLQVAHGELIVIVGPSGCGKSTLLRSIAGLESITAGDLWIDDTRVNDKEPAQRDIAMVFQNYALYPHMTVFDNMAYALKNRGIPKQEREQKVHETAKLLGLEELLERRPRQLSGGQRQRVAMGRAIVRSPKVFLFDEPLSNLDAALRVQMRLEIRRLLKRLGTTAIYVTHDQVEAMTLADRLVVMNGGQVEQVGAPLELYSRPATRFVARFIGSPSMNLMALEAATSPLAKHPLVRDMPAEPMEKAATLGIRPEHLRITDPQQALFRLEVEMVEPLGADTLVYGHAAGIAEQIVVRLDGIHPLEESAQLYLGAERENLHFFDVEGRRV